MSRSDDHRAARGMATAEYSVCLTCAFGFVALLTSDTFTAFFDDLLSAVWSMLLQPGRFLVMALRWPL